MFSRHPKIKKRNEKRPGRSPWGSVRAFLVRFRLHRCFQRSAGCACIQDFMVSLCVVGFQSERTRVSLPRLAGWFPGVRTCCRGRRLLRSWVLGHLCHPACSSRASITLGKLTARFRRGGVSQPGVASRVSAQTCLVTSLRLIQPTELRYGAGDTHAVDTRCVIARSVTRRESRACRGFPA